MTKRFYAVLTITGLTLFSAISSGFTVFYFMFYVLLTSLLASFLLTRLNLAGISISARRRSGRAQVGDYVETDLFIRNASPFPKLFLEVQDMAQLPGHPTGAVLNMGPYRATAWKAEALLRKRGVYQLGPPQAFASDLFGIFSFQRSFPGVNEITVYPHTMDVPYFQLSASHGFHPSISRRLTQDVTPSVSTIRDYKYGDAMRRIHWVSTMRQGKLMVKEFDGDTRSHAWILLDLHQDVQFGDEIDNTEEMGVTLAASVANKMLNMDVPVGFIAYGDQKYVVSPQRSASAHDDLLRVLAVAKAEGTSSLAEVLREERNLFATSSSIVIITSSTSGDWIQAVNTMMNEVPQIVVILVDPHSFGAEGAVDRALNLLYLSGALSYVVRKGDDLSEALSFRRTAPETASSSLAGSAAS